VIYRPETERWSHYFHAVQHFDRTRAVELLEVTTDWARGEVRGGALETFPSGV
jgi:hypothetical protein